MTASVSITLKKEDEKLKRILVFGLTEIPGGVEKFLLNYYRHIDREIIQFDFLCASPFKAAYEDELLALGGRVFHITSRRQNPLKYIKQVMNVFKAHSTEWSAIWVNQNILSNIDYLIIAKRFGIIRRIIHSHNSRSMDSRVNYRNALHFMNKCIIGRCATDYWACSPDAAKWFYAGKTLEKTVLIHNAIEVEQMAFDPSKREKIRKEYGWGTQYVIGSIGRLHYQKNQSFAIDVFQHFHTVHPDSVLVFVGQGEDEQMLREKVGALGLSDAVVFAGFQNDIQGWLSCFDLFLLPSRFEGLCIAAMEAQANGVPVLASNGVISDDARMNENFVFFDLDRGAEAWSRKAEKMTHLKREAFDEIKSRFQRKGYDIASEAGRLEKMLLSR